MGKPGRPVSTRTCDLPGCDRKHAAHGLCKYHYQLHGSPNNCEQEGCTRTHYALGLCAGHYQTEWSRKQRANKA